MAKALQYINENGVYTRLYDGGEPDTQSLFENSVVQEAFISHNIPVAENVVDDIHLPKFGIKNHSYYISRSTGYVIESDNGDETEFRALSLPQYLTGWEMSDHTPFTGAGSVFNNDFIEEYFPLGETNLDLYAVWGDTRFIRVIISSFSDLYGANGTYTVEITDTTSYDNSNVFGMSSKFKNTIDYHNPATHLQLLKEGFAPVSGAFFEVGSGHGCPTWKDGRRYPSYFGVKDGSTAVVAMTFTDTDRLPNFAVNANTGVVSYRAQMCDQGLTRDYGSKVATTITLQTTDNITFTTTLPNLTSDKTIFVELKPKPTLTATVHVTGSGKVEITDYGVTPPYINEDTKTVIKFPGEYCTIWAATANSLQFNGWYRDSDCRYPVPNDKHGHTYQSPQYDVLMGASGFYHTYYADFSYNFLTFTANEDNCTVGFCSWAPSGNGTPTDMGKNLQYTLDDGLTWHEYTIGVGAENVVPILLNAGEKVMFKGNNGNSMAYFDETTSKWNYTKCIITGSVAGSGDTTSVLNQYGGDTSVGGHCFGYMFQDCTTLTSAPNLPSTNFSETLGYFYEHMFENCSSLTVAPSLPSETVAEYCYVSMFRGCTSLVTPPVLPATTAKKWCYARMFQGCMSLVTPPALPATTLADYCYHYMFESCASLSSAPVLNAMRMYAGCYSFMFRNCQSLTVCPALPATTMASTCYASMFAYDDGLTAGPVLPAEIMSTSCYSNMFAYCHNLTSPSALPAMTLARGCYANMFLQCTSLVNPPALPATTMAESCYSGMFIGCTAMTSGPVINSMSLAKNCYSSMFSACTGLTSAPALPATTMAESCYDQMFNSCSSITTAPVLSANTLAVNCYCNMFKNCQGLTVAPNLMATNLAPNCYSGIFHSSQNITTYHFATLNDSVNPFMSNTGARSLTIDATTPPTIGEYTLAGLSTLCIIYVPSQSVTAYQNAPYWNQVANRIQAIPTP